MNPSEKIKLLQKCASMCGINVTQEKLDLIVTLNELIESTGGNCDIRSISRIETEVRRRHYYTTA